MFEAVRIDSSILDIGTQSLKESSFWERNLGVQCRLFELRNKKRISVASTSKLLANTMNVYKGGNYDYRMG